MRWDGIGQATAGLCIVHCMVTPLLLSLAPVIAGRAFQSPWVHAGFAALMVVAAAASFVPGFRRHRSRVVALLAVVGTASVLTALLALRGLGEHIETVVTIAGGSLLIAAHQLNRSCSARCCRPAVHSHGGEA